MLFLFLSPWENELFVTPDDSAGGVWDVLLMVFLPLP